MPQYKTHLVGGTLAGGLGLGAAWYLDIYRPEPLLGAGLICISAMASLFPDVDTSSMARKFFYGLLAILDTVLLINGYYKWAAIIGLAAMLPAIGDHRGWTHTWWAMLLTPAVILAVPLLLYKIPWEMLAPFYLAAVLGYFSHLALDRQF